METHIQDLADDILFKMQEEFPDEDLSEENKIKLYWSKHNLEYDGVFDWMIEMAQEIDENLVELTPEEQKVVDEKLANAHCCY